MLPNAHELQRETTAAGGPLVSIRSSLPPSCSAKDLREFIDRETGEIMLIRQGHKCGFVLVTGSAEARGLRYRRLASGRSVLPTSHRIGVCHRVPSPHSASVEVWQVPQGCAHFKGLMICGSVWVCAVCGSKISERRRAELETATALWRAQGGEVWLLTYTFSHGRFDRLRDSLERLSQARKFMKSGREYKQIRSEYGIIGAVQAAEITHGPAHGWHPHIHELAFVAGGLDMRAFRSRMFERWRRACLRAGLGEPSERYGFDVRGGDEAAGYVAKGLGVESWDRPGAAPQPEPEPAGGGWGLEREVTKGHIKNGRGSNRSPLQILDCAVDREATPEHREQSRLLFLDYAEATKGRRQLSWSPGLRSRFAVPELSDDEIAAQVGEDAVLLASIPLDDWYIIERNGLQAQVLSLAENGGAAAVFALIGAYRQMA
jgi:hypothetical protein